MVQSPFASAALHKLIVRKQWPDALERIKSKPAEVSKIWLCKCLADDIQAAVKAYPLHSACFLEAPITLVIALLDANPRIIKYPDTGHQRLALHHAIIAHGNRMSIKNPEVAFELLDRYPLATAKADSVGRLPLHYALFTKMPRSFIDKLVQLYPDGIKHQDITGWTAAHMAGAAGASLDTMRMMVELCPAALEKIDTHGLCLRDMCIVHAKVSRATVDFLIQETPKSIIMPNEVIVYLKKFPIDASRRASL